jgi:hypothetical protein
MVGNRIVRQMIDLQTNFSKNQWCLPLRHAENLFNMLKLIYYLFLHAAFSHGPGQGLFKTPWLSFILSICYKDRALWLWVSKFETAKLKVLV